MNLEQVNWAKQHDWFVSAREVDGIWFVTAQEILPPAVEGGEYLKQQQEFKWFKELKEWAGY